MTAQANNVREFVSTRVFDAPLELVWKAWTDSKRTAFEAGFSSLPQGWTGTLDPLAAYLAKA